MEGCSIEVGDSWTDWLAVASSDRFDTERVWPLPPCRFLGLVARFFIGLAARLARFAARFARSDPIVIVMYNHLFDLLPPNHFLPPSPSYTLDAIAFLEGGIVVSRRHPRR